MSPAKSPLNSAQCSQLPITGTLMVIDDSAILSPVPDSRSSGNE